MIVRLHKDSRTRCFILNNNHTDKETVSPRLCRRNDNWEPSNASGSIEGAIDRFEQALKIEFSSLKNHQQLKFNHGEKKQSKFYQKLEALNDFFIR